jgi:hypothetical protein
VAQQLAAQRVCCSRPLFSCPRPTIKLRQLGQGAQEVWGGGHQRRGAQRLAQHRVGLPLAPQLPPQRGHVQQAAQGGGRLLPRLADALGVRGAGLGVRSPHRQLSAEDQGGGLRLLPRHLHPPQCIQQLGALREQLAAVHGQHGGGRGGALQRINHVARDGGAWQAALRTLHHPLHHLLGCLHHVGCLVPGGAILRLVDQALQALHGRHRLHPGAARPCRDAVNFVACRLCASRKGSCRNCQSFLRCSAPSKQLSIPDSALRSLPLPS